MGPETEIEFGEGRLRESNLTRNGEALSREERRCRIPSAEGEKNWESVFGSPGDGGGSGAEEGPPLLKQKEGRKQRRQS